MSFWRIARFRDRGTLVTLASCLLVALVFLALASAQAMAGNAAVKHAAVGSGHAAGVTGASIIRPVVRASVIGPGGTVEPEYKKYWILETATVYINPDPGYRIATISDNGKFVEPTSPYKIHFIYHDHDIKVTFRKDVFTVGASAPGGGGTVSPASQQVHYGHTATIDLDPDPGYYTQSITDNGASMPVTDPYYIHGVDRDHSVVVVFAQDTFTVDASVSGGHGTVDPPTQTVGYGGTASITINPDTGYQIATITDNGVSKPLSSPYVINNVMEGHDVVVTFYETDYMVAASVVGGHGTVSPDIQIVAYDDPASITITPDADYHIDDIIDNNVSMPITNPYVIDHVTQHHSVVVNFAPDTFTVDASVSGGHGTVDPPTQTVSYEGTAAINIQPETGYHIATISDNDEFQTISNPYVITQVTTDHDVVVTFAPDTFTVNAAAPGGGGTVDPSTQTVTYGHTAAVDVKPDAGEVISSITDNGVSKPIADPYYIENVTSGHEVLAAFAHGQHPVWYLAEGSTAWSFSTYISIENPGTESLNARLTYMLSDATEQEQTVNLPPLSQVTVNPAAALGEADFSTKVECLEGKTIAVDRTMHWTGPGAPSPEGHNSVGVTAPQNTWYLPEGSSDWGFESWVLVQNPGDGDAQVTLTYMTQGAGALEVERTVPAHSRMNFSMIEDIGAADASVMVTSDVPVIAERSMYRNNRREGHCSIGAAYPAQTFYLAEGTTAWGFTTFVLLQNPGNTAADVTITYMTPTGPKAQPPFTMPPQSRWTINLNDVPDISNTDVSTMVQADAPIVAERAMYWGEGTSLGEACHASIGTASPYTFYYMPDGQTSDGRETYTLVQNPNDTQVSIEVSYLEANGAGQSSFVMDVPALSRLTFNMAETLPSSRASVRVTCLAPGKRIIVERAMYWNDRGAGIESIGGYSD